MTAVGGPPLSTADGEGLAPALRLQILTTEHWSLLSTRAMSWNEAFSRVGMFLSALSSAVVALALVAGATGFSDGFMTFALLLLPVVLFAGVGTFVRLVAINGEDVRWVIGMNRLRHAYLEAAPELRPYFVTGWSDDEAGIMTTFGAVPGPGGFVHEFVTTPGLVAVVDGVVAGALAAVIAVRSGADASVTLVGAVGVGLLTVALLAVHQYRRVVRPRGLLDARFPSDQAGSSTRKR
ncbi:MAG: hypothetical protein ACTS8Z_09765 [Candidatus Limnocylindrales bacterium]